MTDWSHYREIAEAGGRMPFNAAAILAMLDEIAALQRQLEAERARAVCLERGLERPRPA